MYVDDGHLSIRKKNLPIGWFYMGLVYYSSCSEFSVYQSSYVATGRVSKVSGNYTPGSGQMRIGRLFRHNDHSYGSVMVDNLEFWNRPLTTRELHEISGGYSNSV